MSEGNLRHSHGEPRKPKVEVFFDGDCPLCRREVAFLSRRDKHGLIVATDIAKDDFVASDFGRTQADFMATIQGRLSDGTWISGVEVFRNLYEAVGFRRLVRISRLKPIAWILDLSYAFFAKNRLRLTGRCTDSACEIPRPVANDNEPSVRTKKSAKAPTTRLAEPGAGRETLIVVNHNRGLVPTLGNHALHASRSEAESELPRRLN